MKSNSAKPNFSVKFRLFTEIVGDAIIPVKYRKNILGYLEKASIDSVPYFKYGITVYLIALLAVIIDVLFLRTSFFSNVTLIPKILLSLVFFPFIFIILSMISVIFYKFYLDALIYRKTRQMEEIFPEFLGEFSLNLKAGASMEEAMANSMEKEFGYLNEEIQKIVKKVKVGIDVEVAIKEFTSSFKSDIIEETFDLVIISWKKGSKTPQLIDRIYDNITTTRFLKKRVVASVASYRLFLSTITLIIAPAMFALAYYFINLVKSIINKVSITQTQSVFPISISSIKINDLQFKWFSIGEVIIVATFTAMIISIIKTGTVKEGYKQVFVYALLSYISYTIFIFIFSRFFGMFNV
jgi:archaellum biogenesis protein FlaJ (TadC family)